MKVEQLRESVAALGFENGIYDERQFILSCNRALDLIFTDREVTGIALINVDSPKPDVIKDEYIHKGGESSVFPLVGLAYSFRASGRGHYTVKDGSGLITREISGDGMEYRGFISGKGEITFFGDYRFSVYYLSVFDSLISPEVSDIPIVGTEEKIDLYSRIPDFLATASLPETSEGEPIKGARVVGSSLILPRGTSGQIKLVYRRSPKRASSDMREDIDIPRECEFLLPLVVASFMWLEDDTDMAQYYMALYKSTLGTVNGELAGRLDTGYTTNGWA